MESPGPSRPDQHPRLQNMGPSDETCITCVTELFVGLPDEVCNGCTLNPIVDDNSKLRFWSTALQRAVTQTEEERQAEFALGELMNRKEP